MKAISYTAERANLTKTRRNCQAMEETAYLLHSPANARRLLESIAELEAGKGVKRTLIE